jgi:hypothetical protein
MSLMLQTGGASIHYSLKEIDGEWNDIHWTRNNHVFVIEPEISIDCNITSYARLSLGISYHQVSGVETTGLSDNTLSGTTLGVSLKLVGFNLPILLLT